MNLIQFMYSRTHGIACDVLRSFSGHITLQP
jgi:hypothetical protein